MKVFIVEEQNSQQRSERAFEDETIKVGRDSGDCQIVFNSEEWPMVSRRHAEFRLEDGRCLLVDTDSRFGTYLEGRKISQPSEVQAGSQVQFGTGGPTLRIVRIKQSAKVSPGPDIQTQHSPEVPNQNLPPSQPAEQKPLFPPQVSLGRESVFLELVSAVGGAGKRFEIDKEITRLGRDFDMDVRIDADVAVVSRRHAVIERRGRQLELSDQKIGRASCRERVYVLV